MSTANLILVGLPRCKQILEQVGAALVLTGLSAAAVGCYLYACQAIAQLQHLGPEYLARALTG